MMANKDDGNTLKPLAPISDESYWVGRFDYPVGLYAAPKVEKKSKQDSLNSRIDALRDRLKQK